MIHRACYGSLERFLGILIEHYAGAFPLWLAPTQVTIFAVSKKFEPWAQEVFLSLQEKGVRIEQDLRDERVGYKIRQWSMAKIPYSLVIGEEEQSQKNISVRSRDQGDLAKCLYKILLTYFLK